MSRRCGLAGLVILVGRGEVEDECEVFFLETDNVGDVVQAGQERACLD